MTTNELQKNQEEFGHPGGMIGAILQKALNNAHATGQHLHEFDLERYEKAQATIDAIQDGIEELLDGDFMPTPKAIRRALYPSDYRINMFRKGCS